MQTPLGKLHVPKSKLKRQILGWGLVVGGVLGFMPILGFWMLPLGLAMLSLDSPKMRRRRRIWLVKFGRSPVGVSLLRRTTRQKNAAKNL